MPFGQRKENDTDQTPKKGILLVTICVVKGNKMGIHSDLPSIVSPQKESLCAEVLLEPKAQLVLPGHHSGILPYSLTGRQLGLPTCD